MPFPSRILFVGCGNMGGAMLAGWLKAGRDPAAFEVLRPSGRAPAEGVRTVATPAEATAKPDVLLLAVKPQKLAEVAPTILPLIGRETLVVSILAGVEIGSLRAALPIDGSLIRAMPNTPVAIGRGVVALYGAGLEEHVREAAEALFADLGLVEWIAREALFDAVTALSGSGPAFLFRFVDALGQAGAALGLPGDQAARLALATIEGAARLVAGAHESPARLADRVASPGGSTRAGLSVLDEGDALVSLLTATLKAAEQRNREIAEAAWLSSAP